MNDTIRDGDRNSHAGADQAGPGPLAIADIPAALFVFDAAILVAANPEAHRLLGLAPDAPLAEVVARLDPRDYLRNAVLDVAAAGRRVRLAATARIAGGAESLLALHLSPAAQPDRVVVLAEPAQRDVERQFERRLQFERLLAECSAALIRSGGEQLDGAVVASLGAIGAFFRVDRAYVFLFDEAAGTQSNIHEWVAEGITREAHNLQDIPLDTFPWLLQQLRADRVFRVERMADLPAEAVNERTEFEREGIQSLLVVPLWIGTRLHGFVGFDAVRSQVEWGEHYVIGLRLLAQMLSSAFEARTLARRLQRQAFHDALTGLPNRKLLEDRFEQAQRRVRRARGGIIVAVIDVDNFKQVNDRHGHAGGDLALCEVGRRLQATLRGSDTVARMGGDEFVVVAEGNGPDAPALLAERLVGTCAAPLEIEGVPVQVGLSVGLVCDYLLNTTLDGLLRRADAAMYRAKAEGKNRWVDADAELGVD
jgi:diguanylate cyclase (GGDEF)-like protein